MRVIYEKLTKNIVQVVEDQNSISYYPSTYAAIQGDIDEIARVGLLLELDISQIPGIDMTPQLQTVLKKRKKGQDIFNRFLSENELIEISVEDNVAQMSALVNVKQFLESGALATALALISQIPAESFIVTPGYNSGQERKQTYIDEIEQFIESLSLPL